MINLRKILIFLVLVMVLLFAGVVVLAFRDGCCTGQEIGGQIDYYWNMMRNGWWGMPFGGGLWQLWMALASLVLNLVIALLLVLIFFNPVARVSGSMINRPGRSFWEGIVVLIFIPIIIMLFFVTLIGIPIAIALIFFYAAALFFARIFAAIAIGRLALRLRRLDYRSRYYLAALVGVVISWIIFAIPVIGWIFSLLAVIWGLGGFWEAWRRRVSFEKILEV